MSLLINIILFFGTVAMTAIPALAIPDSRSLPTNFLVWSFLGVCALIIVAQVVPMLLALRKQAKLAAAQKKLPEEQRSS